MNTKYKIDTSIQITKADERYINKEFESNNYGKFTVLGIHSVGRNYTKKYVCLFDEGGYTISEGGAIRSLSIKPDMESIEEEIIENILVIGDLHAPFIKDGYFNFCKKMYNKHNCNKVIFIGDILDNHYSSFHESDPEGYGALEELNRAKEQIHAFHKTFPSAYVCLGNHDIIPNRKAFSSGLSKEWIKPISDILNTENWTYGESFVFNDVKYLHGTGRKARGRTKDDLINCCQGHYHSESYIEYFQGESSRLFAMQVGCGIDAEAYAFKYGKNFKKCHINVGLVLNNGKTTLLEYMEVRNEK